MTTATNKSPIEFWQILHYRGIKGTAMECSWRFEHWQNAPGWSYPIYDTSGKEIARRWKAADSEHNPKYTWVTSKGKATYYLLKGTLKAISESGGVLYLASGEPDVLAYRAAGINNVTCWFGEGQVPKSLADDLKSWGVTQVIGYPDNDATGSQWAAKIRKALKESGIEVCFYALPLGDKGDINKLWVEVKFDRAAFTKALAGCPTIDSQPEPQIIGGIPVITLPTPKKGDKELPQDYIRAIEGQLKAGKYNSDGWSAALPCVFKTHEHDDKQPSGRWHKDKNIFHCFKCNHTWLAKEVGEAIGIRIQDYIEKPTTKEEKKKTLEESPEGQQTLHKPTDDELAAVIMEQWEGNYRYFHSGWHKYGDGYWQHQRNVNLFIRNVMMNHKRAGIKPSKAKAGSIEWFLQTELEVTDEAVINDAPNYLNLSNGLFNIETKKLEEHRRDLYVTTKLDYPFDPDAEYPHWQRFLTKMLVDEQGQTDWRLIELVQEAFYYSLSADVSRRVSFWVVGPTGSGKSTLINLLVALMRGYHTTVDLNQIGTNRFLLSQIAGKRLVTFGEADANTRLADGIYKMLVSKDEIVADVKNKEPIKFRSQAKIWWGMNNLPVLADRSGAVDVRVIIIPMRNALPREQWDFALDAKLEAERSGILNWSLFGGKRLERAGDFTYVPQVELAREEYKADNDVELTFAQDVTKPEGQTPAQLLYTAYRQWCQKNGHQPKSSTKIARDWQRLGWVKEKRMDSNVYVGVSLTEEGFKLCS